MTLPIRNSRIKLTQGQLFWREVGQGTTIVFLHGTLHDSEQWLPVIEHLGKKHHCIAPDLLGFGDSDRPNLHYSIELEVECLAEYLDGLRLRQVYFVGHEIGGWVAATYALRFPNQVKGLVLLSAEGIQVQGAGQRWQQARWLTRKPALWILQALRPLARLVRRQEAIDRLLLHRREWMRSWAAAQLLFQRRKIEIQSELLNDRLPWLKTPILILQGEQEGAIASALNRAYATAPDAKLQIIARSNSAINTATDQVAWEIERFVTSK